MIPGDVKTFDIRDICITEFDEAFEKFHSANIPLAQLPRVNTKGIHSSRFEILWRLNTHDSLQEARVPCHHWVVHVPHPSREAISSYCQHPEGHKQALLQQADAEVTWHIRGNLPAIALVTHHSVLEGLMSTSELDLLHTCGSQVQRRHLDLPKLRDISAQIIHQISTVSQVPSPNSRAVDELGCAGVLQLLELVLNARPGATRIGNRDRLLTRALDYIRQNYATDIRLADIANHAHTTTRNLQIVFKSRFGLTPLQFLKRYRLIRFHQGLRRYGSVTEAATQSGLRHMGRLPDHYPRCSGKIRGDYLGRRKPQPFRLLMQNNADYLSGN